MTKYNKYEDAYRSKNHFSFGKNWQMFLKTLDSDRIENAKKSLTEFLGGESNVRGKTFVDIGCGSGLFSLAAHKLGASKILSVDVDDFSVACATHLREKENNPVNWEIKKGSALDEKFISSLGKFDIVYSWGVLHHTGEMYRAFDNIVGLMDSKSVFYTAIYGRSNNKFGGTSNFWLKVKKTYNNSGDLVKRLMNYIYVAYYFLDKLATAQNPIKTIREYQKTRGMNWYNDIIDWLGGYPYEFAAPDEIINYFGKKGLYCKKLKYEYGLACHEYLLVKAD